MVCNGPCNVTIQQAGAYSRPCQLRDSFPLRQPANLTRILRILSNCYPVETFITCLTVATCTTHSNIDMKSRLLTGLM